MDKETIQILLDLLNPLHGEIDRQTYDERYRQNFDAPADAEYNIDITTQMERDLTQAVLILESRLRDTVSDLTARSDGVAQRIERSEPDEGRNDAGSTPVAVAPSATDLHWCGYCQSWNSRPCGEQCHWLPTDPTPEEMRAKNIEAIRKHYRKHL